MMDRAGFGRENEKRAEKYLRAQKHRIIATNYHAKHGEIDIISVLPGELLVFTEVRSKHDCRYGHPAETVTSTKQAHVRQAAERFLYDNPKYQGYGCRFDVVTIVGEGKEAVIEHFPDAF